MFNISFLPPTQNWEVQRSAELIGEITIGEFRERFTSSVAFWRKEDYQKQWREGANRILNGADRSCLITSISKPEQSNYLVWWPIFRIGQTLIFHNQIYLLADKSFDPKDPYKYIEDREILSEDGIAISEWKIGLSEIKEFLIRKSHDE